MALEIFKLVGSIFVDSDAADKSLQKTDNEALAVGKTLAKGVGTAAKWGAAAVTAATAAAKGLTDYATKTANAMDEIDKMSQMLGMSKTAYQEWDYVLSQSGVEITDMATGMKTLTNQLDDARTGSEKAAERFARLGISMEEMNTLSREEIFARVVEGMQSMEDSTERAALANDLFGKSGQNLTALFNETAESTANLKKQAHDLGMVMSDETVKAGVDLNDTLDTLKRAFGGVVNRLGAQLMPILQKVAEILIDRMPQISAMFDRLGPIVTRLFDSVLPPLLDLGDAILPLVMDLLDALLPIFSEIMETVLPIFEILGPIFELLKPIFDLINAIIEPIVSLMGEALGPTITMLMQLIDGALMPLRSVLGGFIDFLKNVFTGNWKGAWDSIVGIFKGIWEGMKKIFTAPINWIIDGINFFIRQLNKIQIPDWVPLVGGLGFHIGEIPHLAKGGVLEEGQTGFLEGNGAEAVVPLHENEKWIHAVAKDMQNATGITGKGEALLTQILEALQELLGMGIYLDTDALVGGIARPMDRALGALRLQKART